LAKSIKLLISDYEKYKNIAEKGRLHVIDNFNWTKITEEYESVMYKIIEDYKNANL
jgi:glycosyltransferase involved in cell wall biosynthesis